MSRLRGGVRGLNYGLLDEATSLPIRPSGGPFAATADTQAIPGYLSESQPGPAVERMGLRALRDMSRGFSRNNTIGGAYARSMLDNTIGPRIPTPDWDAESVSEDDRVVLRQKWQSFLRAPVGAGSLPGREVLRKVFRHTIIDGDVLLLPFKSPNGRIGFNFFTGEEFDDTRDARRALNQGAFVQNGVEVDRRTGIVRGYWIKANNGFGASQFFAAETTIHMTRSDNLKSYRGLPWMTPAMDAMLQIAAYDKAELTKLALGSLVYTALTCGVDVAQGDTDAIKAGFLNVDDGPTQKKVQQMTAGSMMKLDPGYEVANIEVGPRSLGQMEFRTRKVNEVCAALGIMPARLTGSFDQVNFSASRMAAAVEQRMFRDVQQWLVSSLLEPVFAMVVSDAIAEGAVSDRAILNRELMRPEWRFSGWPSTEIHRELLGIIKAIEAQLMSREQGLRIIGDITFDTMLRDNSREKAALIKAGLWDDLPAQQAKLAAATKAGAMGGRPPGAQNK